MYKDSLVYLVTLVCEGKVEIRVVTMLCDRDIRMFINDCVITIVFQWNFFGYEIPIGYTFCPREEGMIPKLLHFW